VIGIVYALIALLAVAIGAAITFAIKDSRARDQREAARILASSNAGELVRAKELITRLTANLTSEQERSNALDDELAKTYDHPDPVGARERVLQAWKLQHDVARGRAVAMPAPPTAAATGPADDDLLKPGE
jgi:uncharacterized membrane protein YccC